MNFIDTTGHVFSLPSYDDIPLHLKYKEGDYVFWLKDQEISINNYYILPIRMIVNINDVIFEYNGETIQDPLKLDITIDSNFYKLLGPKYIQEKLEQNNSIKESIEIDFDEAKSALSIDDFYFDKVNNYNNLIVESGTEKYYLFPFYVIGKCDIEGTILSNIMIKMSTKSESVSVTRQWFTRDQLYDYFLKKTMTDIKIYEVDPETGEETYYTSIRTGYNTNVEILYPYFTEDEVYESIGTHRYSTVIHSSLDKAENEEDKQNHWYRIRNWGNSGMPNDVYHYIYNLPQDKWLLPNHCYRFEGEVFQSCKYCGSSLLANHDGAINEVDNSLLDPNGVPFYKEEYDYDENTGRYIFRENKFFYSSKLAMAAGIHGAGDGFKFADRAIVIPANTTIRDIFFDVDNAALVNSSNGGYIEDRTLKDKDEYTQITIGGTFIDEQEELIINGRNMGIQLPKEIIKSIYESSFYHKYSNEKLLKDKMKELLLNYMSIKGECGNFKSIYNSLKWFGWGGKVEISKLIKTDNEFQNQFILDYFSITTDIKDVYRFFNPTNMISLSVKGNEEERLDIQNHNNSFLGEGKPIMKDLFDEVVEVKDQGISFYKPYYDFVFIELALKLDCLKYYYQRYFLPIHIKINRASIDYKVYANTVKMTAMGFEKQTEAPVYIPNKNLKVIFPEEKELIYYRSEHYIDSMFNEFNIYNERYDNEDNDLFYVNENCIVIPLIFRDLNKLYSKSNKGEYLLINGEYIKPYAFTTIDGEECDPEYAKRYVLYPGYEAEEFIDVERYTKISEGYFDCRIYVTYTVKEQADNGHYVYKDGEYLYKEKFYNDFGGEDDNGNYTYFWGNKETGNSLEYVPSKNRYKIVTKNLLDRDNNFVFYQDGNTYYRNLILIPRLLNTKDIDWLNTDFRISVLLNNTWFTYDFRVKIPDLYLEFGRLKYRYFVQNDFTMFNQVDKITSEDIKFNVFMYQPDLITINSLFMKENTDTEVQTFLDKICSLEYIESEYGDYLFSEDIQGNWQFYKPFKFINENNEETDLIHATHYIPTENHAPVSLKGERRFNKRDINEEMYEFYNKYYRKKIQVPYNKNYYNQIHLFKIKSNMNGIDHIIKLEGYSLAIGESWEEWSPYNGGENNIIKGWRNYLSDILEEYPNALIRFYRDDTPLDSININNLLNYYNMTYENIEYKLPELDNEDGSINKFYIINNGEILDTLCRYDGCVFQYLYTKEHNFEVNHTHVNLYWYSINEINDSYNLVSTDQLIYDENTEYTTNKTNVVKLYRNFFNDDGTLKFNIKENIPYDFYLMHDKLVDGKEAYWYGVFISKYPVGNYNEEDLKIQNPFYNIDGKYELKYDGTSIEKFLVNRMDIEKANGYNHFNQNDLIIVSVKNNDYHFNIDLTNKWTINLISDFNNINVVRGNTNILIIPNNNYSHLYSPGYYNVLLNYSINGLADHTYLTKGYYRVNYEVEDIEYPELIEIEPEVKKYDVRDTISDFTILYEDENGNWLKTTEVIDPSLGYHPIGIKIMNKHYFGREQDWDIYIALKFLSINNPDNGWQGSGPQNQNDIPRLGFYGINIPTLKDYDYICYKDANHNGSVIYMYPQTDAISQVPKNEDGTPKWPAPNGRGWHFDPNSSSGQIYNIDLLNDDDTFNSRMIDDNCAVSDWNGWENTQKIIEAFSPEYDCWQTSGTINNIHNKEFSPVCACAWRYHTRSTLQGDWYIPSYAEVFFLSYNFQRLTDLFNEIATLYPDDCKIDMISSINALWTSTEYDKNEMWEIHPAQHAHTLSKSTYWISFPYLRVGENGVYRSSNNSQNEEEGNNNENNNENNN